MKSLKLGDVVWADDIKEWVMRLVVDKSRKKHIPSSRICERIDFNDYIQGGYYSIPQAVKDESLLDGVVIHVSGCELFIDTVDIY